MTQRLDQTLPQRDRVPAGPDAVRAFRRAVTRSMLADAAVERYPGLEREVLGFVDERIGSMPAHLRLGVLGTEWLLLVRSRLAAGGRPPRPGLASDVRRWGSSRLPPVTQYVRLIRSLVLLAAHELAEDREGPDR